MAVFNAGSIEATLDLDVDPFQRGIAQARAEGKKFAGEKFTATLELDTAKAKAETALVTRQLERAARTYSAKFEVDGMAAAITQAKALDSQLAALGGDRSLDFNTSGAEASLGRTRRGIYALIPALAILSTGLVPLTAAAVPVLGLASNLTLAAGAAGTAILAFQGVGGALKAANEAAISPTAENLEKLRAAQAGLTPEAREFVDVLRSMSSEAKTLQQTAANGLFPDLTAGLRGTDLTDYQGLIYELSNAAGVQLGDTLQALDDPRWVTFFTFLRTEARSGVSDLSDAIGNLAGGFAGLWQAFDPLNDDFSDWLVSSTAGFDRWANGLQGTERFEDFLAYVREAGPEAGQALSALGGALVDIVVAAAPLGGVVLDMLEGVGNAISFIAEQPFGDTLLTGAAALYGLNRALALTEGLLKRVGVQSTAAGTGGGIVGGITGRADELRKTLPTLSQIGTRFAYMGQSAQFATEKTLAAREATKGLGKVAGTAALGVGALTLLSTDAGEQIGLTNTAMLGLAGSMMGPLGAAAGATVGFFLDIRGASKAATDAVDAYNAAVGNQFVSMSQQQSAAQGLMGQWDDMFSSPSMGTRLDVVFGGYDSSKLAMVRKEAEQAKADMEALDMVARMLAKDFGIVDTSASNTSITMGQMDEALRSAQPAMEALGISTADMIAAGKDGSIIVLLDRIEAWQQRADSAAGRTREFANTVEQLGNDALSTAQSATAMGDALEALLSPTLNLEQATDQWRMSLRELEKGLKAGAGFEGMTKAALANRQLTRDYTTDSMARLKALAAMSTTTERDMAKAVSATRREFIQSGIAAGFSRKQIVARANALGLTPKLVRTVFEAAGIDQTDLKARRLREVYRNLPKDVRTAIREEGAGLTMAKVNQLIQRYELTEKQRTAIIAARDLASPVLSSVDRWLTMLDGKRATTYIDTIRSGARTVPGIQMATGGPVVGPGSGTSDDVPIWGSNGEHMWTAKEVANAGGHAAVEAIRQHFRYAAGGPMGWDYPTSKRLDTRQASALRSAVAPGVAGGLTSSDVDRIVAAIEANRSVYAAVSSTDELRQAARAIDNELRRT